MLTALFTVLAFCQIALCQFVSTPTNFTTKQGHANVTIRYKEVPAGVCEQDPNVASYSGYADVSENEHIFWWFFAARNVDPTTAPLTVWINGGPGSSSMIGLFQELGPCTVNSSGAVVDNPYSWSNVSNMLFIDQPTQTGFSYSSAVPGYIDPENGNIVVLQNETCPDYAEDWSCGTYSLPDVSLTANSTPNAAPNMYLTLQGFMGAFPQYSQGDFFFATESYGGHYGPIFNQYFLDQNKLNASGTVPINLNAVLIGNGWFDPLVQYEAYYNYTVYPGNPYDLVSYNSSWEQLAYNNMYGAGNCYDQIVECYNNSRDDSCSSADSFCYNNVEYIFDRATGRDEYDVRYIAPDPFPPVFYIDYLNSPDVQEAIGAYVNYSESSPTVGTAFSNTGDDARAFDIPSVIGNLVRENITVVLYFGDADYVCNYIGGLAVLDLITPQPASFSSATYTPILSSSSNSSSPRGEVRQASNFAYARIYTSGHEVPFYQPELALTMFARVVNGTDIATGTKSAVGTLTSGGSTTDSYREGNATVQYDVVDTDAVYDWESGLPILSAAGGNGTANGTNSSVTASGGAVKGRFARGVDLYAQRASLREEKMGKAKKEKRSKLGYHHRAQGQGRNRAVRV